jgi:hypothetical protein
MPTEIQTRPGHCASHGTVVATRTIPGSGFPYLVNAVRRWMAKRRPFRCPTCGGPVSTA